jgi:protein-tyrosine phosphatase
VTRANFHILVVCTGNICRSPLTERLLRRRLDDRLGRGAEGIVVSSAGARGLDRSPMDLRAAEQLRRLGGDPEDFLARSLTEWHVNGADLVLTATRGHRAAVLSEAPAALHRTFTLLEFADLAPYRPLDAVEPGRDQLAGLVAEAAQRRGSATLQQYDVLDPYMQSAERHREVADVISTAVDRIVDGLVDAHGAGAAVADANAGARQ